MPVLTRSRREVLCFTYAMSMVACQTTGDTTDLTSAQLREANGIDRPWPADCEERYIFRAHGRSQVADDSAYEIPANSEYYASFMFRPPWLGEEVQALELRSLVQNPAVVHHWILYGSDDAEVQDGAVSGAPSQRFPVTLPGEAFIQGWAPGGDDLTMPSDVGLHLPGGARSALRLELHYNNSTSAAQQDSSGIELCLTRQKRPQEAAVHWLGTPFFSVPAHSQLDVVSQCEPQLMTGPVHMKQVAPHMHRLGVGAKATLQHGDGRSEMLLDTVFDFNNQRSYALPADGSAPDVLVEPGDTITTTCRFSNDTNAAVSFGPRTEDEMCFFFLLAWPRGQLTHGARGLIPGTDPSVNCLR